MARKKSSLLYVSDAATNEVYIYTYPSVKLVGILTGFNGPHGLCVNSTNGDVWVANTMESNLILYGHGSVLPKETLKDNGQYPMGCSVRKNVLAVSNAQTVSGGLGSVTIFGSGSPKNYPVTTMNTLAYITYDASGDVFVDGSDASGSFQFAELPNGKSTFKALDIGQAIGIPGGLQPYGKYVVVGDESTNTVYLVVNGSAVGSTSLGGASQVVQFFIDGSTLIGPDAGDASIGFWKYPAGGSPTLVISGSYLTDPVGSALSSI